MKYLITESIGYKAILWKNEHRGKWFHIAILEEDGWRRRNEEDSWTRRDDTGRFLHPREYNDVTSTREITKEEAAIILFSAKD